MTKRSKKVAYVLSNEIKWNSQSLAYLFLFGVYNIDEENSILISETSYLLVYGISSLNV